MQNGKFIIRSALPRDYDDIGRLLYDISALHRQGRPDLFRPAGNKYNREAYAALLADEKTIIFVAEKEAATASEAEGGIAGYIICKHIIVKDHGIFNDYSTLYIDDLCVDASSRGLHIGTELMNAAEEYARMAGCHNLTLNVWEFNENAKAFYERLGYKTQRKIMEHILD